MRSEYDGREHEYTRKRGVVHKEILLPDHAPAEYSDREVLWNAVEKAETPKNAQLARELELALPVELTREQNIALARDFINRHFVAAGMCADICVHHAKKNNPHAHVMLTMRPIEQDGSWGAKSRKEYILDRNGNRIKLKSGEYKTRKICTVDWNDQSKAEEWRSAWGDAVNAALEQQNHSQRVDHRSYKRQGLDIIPQIRMGVAATQMERRGIRTEKGDRNRAIAVTNQQLGQLRARIKKLKDWIYAQPIQDAPTMLEAANAVFRGRELKTQWQKVNDLKTYAKVSNFLIAHNIADIEQLGGKVEQLHNRRYDLACTIHDEERRITTLDKHLANVETKKEHERVYKKYKRLTPKKDVAAMSSLNPLTRHKATKAYEAAVQRQAAYYEKHAGEIEQYEAAATYLAGVLNGRTENPEKAWRVERETLIANKYAHCDEYYKLKEDVRTVEVIRRGAEKLIQEATPERTPTRARAHDMSH